MSFLPIGHTHSDIDRALSSVLSVMRREDAITMEDLLRLVRTCYGDRVRAEEMLTIPNFSRLCENEKCLNDIRSLYFTQYSFLRFDVDEGVSWHGSYWTKYWVKVQESHTSKKLRSDGTGFLRSIPDLSQVPNVNTQILPSLVDINIFLSSAKQRINDEQKMQSLYSQRERVYKVRNIPFSPDLKSGVEYNGDYRNCSDENSGAPRDHADETDITISDHYGYSHDSFVALKSSERCWPFWIARVKEVIEIGHEGKADRLQVSLYQASNAECEP